MDCSCVYRELRLTDANGWEMFVRIVDIVGHSCAGGVPASRRDRGAVEEVGWPFSSCVPLALHFLPLFDKITNVNKYMRELCKVVVGMVR